MEKIDLILWIISGGFAMNFALMLIMWNSLNKKIDDVEDRLSKKIDKTGDRIDKLSEKVEDVDRRLCRIEGSLATSGHCLFSQSKPELKVE